MTSVYLGDSISYVASKAFTSTESLVEVFITSSDFKISNDAFYNAGYNDLVVYLNEKTLSDLDKDGTPDVISVIEEDNDVRTASIEDIVCLQYSVVNGNEIKIAGIASHVCPNGHNRLVIPETIDGKAVTTISNDAFADNHNVVKIYLPATVKKIGESAFKGASKLYDIAFYHYDESGAFVETSSNAYFAVDGGALYSVDYKYLYAYMAARSEVEMNVNRNARYVKANAFYHATNLLSVTFLEDLYDETGISPYAITFLYCLMTRIRVSTTSQARTPGPPKARNSRPFPWSLRT